MRSHQTGVAAACHCRGDSTAHELGGGLQRISGEAHKISGRVSPPAIATLAKLCRKSCSHTPSIPPARDVLAGLPRLDGNPFIRRRVSILERRHPSRVGRGSRSARVWLRRLSSAHAVLTSSSR